MSDNENQKEKEEVQDETQKQEMVLKQDYDELDDRYKRVHAEFENYKKRSQKERETLYSSVLSDAISAIKTIKRCINIKRIRGNKNSR